jgi:hypothetical protein
MEKAPHLRSSVTVLFRLWHSFPVRCAAANPSGIGGTSAVPATLPACLFMTQILRVFIQHHNCCPLSLRSAAQADKKARGLTRQRARRLWRTAQHQVRWSDCLCARSGMAWQHKDLFRLTSGRLRTSHVDDEFCPASGRLRSPRRNLLLHGRRRSRSTHRQVGPPTAVRRNQSVSA